MTKIYEPSVFATSKTIEKVRPGMWWFETYDDGEFWAECTAVLTFINRVTGGKLIELRGTATDGHVVDRQHRDYLVPTLTAAQARKCGLTR